MKESEIITINNSGRNARRIIRTIYHLVSILLICWTYSKNYKSIDTNAYFYLFSSISQVFAAVFAIMGTFLVFRTNLIDNKIDQMDIHFKEVIKEHCKKIYSPVQIKNLTIEKIEPFITDKAIVEPMKGLFDQYKRLLTLRIHQTKVGWFSFLYIIAIIFISILFIYLTPYFQINPALGKAILRAELLLSFWGLFECCFYVWGLIKDHPFSD